MKHRSNDHQSINLSDQFESSECVFKTVIQRLVRSGLFVDIRGMVVWPIFSYVLSIFATLSLMVKFAIGN